MWCHVPSSRLLLRSHSCLQRSYKITDSIVTEGRFVNFMDAHSVPFQVPLRRKMLNLCCAYWILSEKGHYCYKWEGISLNCRLNKCAVCSYCGLMTSCDLIVWYFIFSMALPAHSGPRPLIHFPQTVGLLRRVISPSQGRYLNTRQHKHRVSAYTPNIHALSWIRTHDPSVRASEDSSCLRPRGYCHRRLLSTSDSK
jgi:hypothetical protein